MRFDAYAGSVISVVLGNEVFNLCRMFNIIMLLGLLRVAFYLLLAVVLHCVDAFPFPPHDKYRCDSDHKQLVYPISNCSLGCS